MADQDKFTLTKFSFHIEYYVLRESIVLKSYVRMFPSQHLIMDLKLFKLSEVFIW